VVAASRTEERSSFYHVSRWAAGRGHGSPPPRRGEPCTESRRRSGPGRRGGGEVGGSGKGPGIILAQDETTVPPLARARARTSERASERRSDFRRIKSPRRWRGGDLLLGPRESRVARFRISREIRSIPTRLYLVASATSRVLTSRERDAFVVFSAAPFSPPPPPLTLFLFLSIAYRSLAVVARSRGGDGVLDRSSGPAILEEDRR